MCDLESVSQNGGVMYVSFLTIALDDDGCSIYIG